MVGQDISLVCWGEVFASWSAVAKKVGRKFSAIVFCNSSVANTHTLTSPNKNLPTCTRRFEVVTEMVMVSI